jgi:hypothetical protein
MKPELHQAMTTFNSEPLTVNDGQFERCANPFCQSDMTPRTGKKSCCDRCRMDRYVLRRAKAMVKQVGIIEFNEMLERF